MDLKYMQQLAGAARDEHCGCEDDIAEARTSAEDAIWKAMPPDSRKKIGGDRKVMLTGSIAKAAKLPEYTTIKLTDLTDHQIKSVLALIQRKREDIEEFSSMPVENLLLHEDTPELLHHCVRAVAKKYDGDKSKAYAICTSQLQKAGYLEPDSIKLTAAGKKKEAQHKNEDFEFNEEGDGGPVTSSPPGGPAPSAGTATPTAMPPPPSGPPTTCTNCGCKGAMPWRAAIFGVSPAAWYCPKCGHPHLKHKHKKKKKKKSKKKHEGTDMSVADQMRDLLGLSEAGKKTYAQAQADIMNGLEKDGWKVNRTLKVPHATSPTGDFKLFFKAQAIYKTHGKGDLGNARSLHLPDIRQTGYGDFTAALSRWTGRDIKDQPLPKKPAPAAAPAAAPAHAPAKAPDAPAAHLTPDQYHAKHGKCPEGHHWDEGSKRCVKAGTEAVKKLCPDCKQLLSYKEETDDWVCDGCGPLRTLKPRKAEGIDELRRLIGLDGVDEGYKVGTIRQRKDGKYQKKTDGSWELMPAMHAPAPAKAAPAKGDDDWASDMTASDTLVKYKSGSLHKISSDDEKVVVQHLSKVPMATLASDDETNHNVLAQLKKDPGANSAEISDTETMIRLYKAAMLKKGKGGKGLSDVVKQCIADGVHLKSVDDDGYCNNCGSQEGGKYESSVRFEGWRAREAAGLNGAHSDWRIKPLWPSEK